MPGPRQTEAERFAHARQEFVEAMARGCTIQQLRETKTRERQELRMRARSSVADHTSDLMGGTSAQASGDFLSFEAPWMMRD